jgi:hypothetical protein
MAEAERRGLTVLAGIPIPKAGPAFDYGDPAPVALQEEAVRAVVRQYRDHPSLLIWAIGDEPERDAAPEDRVHLWQAIDRFARAAKQEDPNHPVITVVAGVGDGKAAEILEYTPSLDALGVNAYASAGTVRESLAAQGWNKPYILTEFGPRADWETDLTEWKVPIEDDSTVKARHYRASYQAAVADNPLCLGSYVYYWGNRQERTHTWYSMFLPEGNSTSTVDAVTYLWTGSWPPNRAPWIGPAGVSVEFDLDAGDTGRRTFPPATTLHCAVDAGDPEDDPLLVEWELRSDNSATGHRGKEEPTPPALGGVVRTTQSNRAVIVLPERPGDYRIFAYVEDPAGSVATVNVPIQVVEPSL